MSFSKKLLNTQKIDTDAPVILLDIHDDTVTNVSIFLAAS